MPLNFLRRKKTAEPKPAKGSAAPGAPAPAKTPVAARSGVAFDGLTEEWRLIGRMSIDGRLLDSLNKREAIEIIRAAGATPTGVLIALDRQERGAGELSAAQEVNREFGVPVAAIATLADILATLRARPDLRDNVPRIEAYRRQYGVRHEGQGEQP